MRSDSGESYPPLMDRCSPSLLSETEVGDVDLDHVAQELERKAREQRGARSSLEDEEFSPYLPGDEDDGLRRDREGADAASLKRWAEALASSRRRAADEAKISPPRPILKRSMSTSTLMVQPYGALSATGMANGRTRSTSVSNAMGQNAGSGLLSESAAGAQGKVMFSNADQMHATWPADVYDRRGGPATCNLLTPQLAEMIKEELNTFKMEEMAVAPSSRIFTQFFV